MSILTLAKIYLSFAFLSSIVIGGYWASQKIFKERWKLWLFSGVSTSVMLLFMWGISSPEFGLSLADFDEAYYPAGSLILRNPSSLYDWSSYVDSESIGFVNIPILAYLFTPFSLLNQSVAHLLFSLLSVIGIVGACYLLIKLTQVSGWKRAALIGLFVINGPLYSSFKIGNTTHFILLLLIAALFYLQAKREIIVGLLIAVAALIKIPLFLLGIYFILRQRWRIVAGFGAGIVVIVGLSVLTFGIDLHIVWLERCILFSAGKPLAAYNVQSIDGFLVRLLTDSSLHSWKPIEVGWEFKAIRYVLFSFLSGATIWIFWQAKKPRKLEEENLEFCIILCLALILSPISWTHYYLFFLLPLGLYLGDKLAVPSNRLWFSQVILATFLISPPTISAVAHFEPENPILRFLILKLFISHWFLGGLLIFGVLLAGRWYTSSKHQLFQRDS